MRLSCQTLHRGKWILAAGLSLLVFLIAIIRAAATEITYDESFTYLNYVRHLHAEGLGDLFVSSQTNNHLLNTLAIWVIQVVSGSYYNEFLIRLPNLVVYGLYLGLVLYLLARQKIPIWMFALLVFQVHLHEFFGLARGYGMATGILLYALYCYGLWVQNQPEGGLYLSASLLLFSLAGLAVTYVIVMQAALGLDALLRLLRTKQLRRYIQSHWVWLAVAAALSLTAALFQLFTSRNTPFVPGGAGGLFAFYKAFFQGFFISLLGEGWLAQAGAACLVLWFAASMVLFWKEIRQSSYTRLFLLNLGVWMAVVALGSYIPLGRGYLIFYPLTLFALGEWAGWWRGWLAQKRLLPPKGQKALTGMVAGLISLGAGVAFFTQVEMHVTRDWRENYGIRAQMYEIYAQGIPAESLAASHENTVHFYREKILYQFGYDIFTGQKVE